jgi:prepilin-type N-terminal cleavage/methylation domain-containing protein
MMKNNGFTLIELVVVVAIAMILMAIAGISGKAWLDKYRVESQMKEMSIDMMNARVSAMQRSRMYMVVFSPSAAAATQYTIYEDTDPYPDGNGTLETGSDRQVLQKSINPIYAVQTEAAQIDFDQKGLVSGMVGTATTVRVNGSFGSAYDCIVITLTGLRMGAWNGATCAVQ